MDGRAEPKVKSLAKALNILSCFTIQEPILGVTELANRIGVTKSNIHNILSTFTSMGYLQRLPDGRYTLGLKILEYAFIINQNLGYPNAVYDILVETASRTGEIVYFGLPYGTNVLYLYVAHPADRLGVLPIGTSWARPLPSTAPASARPSWPTCPRRSGSLTSLRSAPSISPTPSPIWTAFWRSCASPAAGAIPSTTASVTPTSAAWACPSITPPDSWWPG